MNKEESDLTGKIKMVGPVGSESLIYLDYRGIEILAKADRNQNFNENDEVGLLFSEENLYKFDNETGERI